MNVLTYLTALRPCMPTSAERAPAVMTNGEVRRLLKNKAILINGDNDWAADEEVPEWVWELVYFPKAKRRTTLVQFNFADLLTLYPVCATVASSIEPLIGATNE